MIYVIVAAILIVITCVLFLPLKLELLYKEKQYSIRALLAGIPVYKLKKKEKGDTEKAKTPEEKVEKVQEETASFSEKIKKFTELFKTAVKLINRHVSIDNVDLKVDVGTGDAPSTAIASGALWGLCYNQLGLIGSIAYIKNHNVAINPIYDKATFSFEGKCIFKTRIVYIIIIAITILIKIKSRKGKEE